MLETLSLVRRSVLDFEFRAFVLVSNFEIRISGLLQKNRAAQDDLPSGSESQIKN